MEIFIHPLNGTEHFEHGISDGGSQQTTGLTEAQTNQYWPSRDVIAVCFLFQ